jgi:hypothetical protein
MAILLPIRSVLRRGVPSAPAGEAVSSGRADEPGVDDVELIPAVLVTPTRPVAPQHVHNINSTPKRPANVVVDGSAPEHCRTTWRVTANRAPVTRRVVSGT